MRLYSGVAVFLGGWALFVVSVLVLVFDRAHAEISLKSHAACAFLGVRNMSR